MVISTACAPDRPAVCGGSTVGLLPPYLNRDLRHTEGAYWPKPWGSRPSRMEARMQGMTYSRNERRVLDLSLERKTLGVSPGFPTVTLGSGIPIS